MATLTLTIPDERLAMLRLEAEERGLQSPEALLLSLVDSEFGPSMLDPIDSLPPGDKVTLEAELVRRLESDHFVAMDEADWGSIHASIAAKRDARRKR